jgi:hypothetical protein
MSDDFGYNKVIIFIIKQSILLLLFFFNIDNIEI